jgi:hypothetical protein
VNKFFFFLVIFLVAFAGCSSPGVQQPATPTPSENPPWVDELITKFQSEPVGNPPQSIWRYEYKGQTVYFVPQQCCDMFSTLYDANGAQICAPDGGIAGQGDGKCPDFFAERTGETLIWQDPRTH